MSPPRTSAGAVRTSTKSTVTLLADTDPLEPFRNSAFTEPVAELEKLLSQSRRVFLFGAGCSKCAGLPLMPELTDIVLKKLEAKPDAHAVLQGLQCNFENATGCTIEDYMSELVDLVCIADRRERRTAKDPKVPLGSHWYSSADLLQSLAEIKDAIAGSISQTDVKIEIPGPARTLRSFGNMGGLRFGVCCGTPSSLCSRSESETEDERWWRPCGWM
jgi:hypothetical protein